MTEEQHRLLIGEAKHLVNGQDLGRRYRTYKMPEGSKRRHPVAGYDLTFSVPESASVLWGVSDAGTQAIIAAAHHAAVAETTDFLEREVIATRGGARGPKGGVAQLDVTGVIATTFDHNDSRANDPHLHTHVVISNRVKATRDGQCRRPLVISLPLPGATGRGMRTGALLPTSPGPRGTQTFDQWLQDQTVLHSLTTEEDH